MSNPCFEFWLLLHFDEVMDLDKDKLLANEKVTTGRRYAEYELRRIFEQHQVLPRYTKSRYNTAELLSRIDKAIQNETKFCEDEDKIENEVGSCVGLLIKELKS